MAKTYSKINRIRVDGAKLTAARMDANKSLEDVAKEFRCNKSSVSRWEQGTLIPSEERIMRMVMMFGRGDFVIKNENGGSE